jgi:hypothetical protein
MRIRSIFGTLFGVVLWATISVTGRGAGLLGFLASAGKDDITAVDSQKLKSYIRVQLPNGKFQKETYLFGPGGCWSGEMADATIDNLKFADVAKMLISPLATQDYVQSPDPNAAKFVIMLYWGTSHGEEHALDSNGYQNLQTFNRSLQNSQRDANISPSGKQGGAAMQALFQAQNEMALSLSAVAAENKSRDKTDVQNINMLGYASWWDQTDKFEGTPLRVWRQDLIDEIEEDRYFVVLMAYDYQLLKRKKHKLVWETRFSIRVRHHGFDSDVPAMAKYASQFFGQDSHGLVHKELPNAHVDVGPLKNLGEAPQN